MKSFPSKQGNQSMHSKVTFKFSSLEKGAKVSLKIKTDGCYRAMSMAKVKHSLEEVMQSRYYQKEWLQDDLRHLGISPTGTKNELVYRLLETLRKQGYTVRETAEYLIPPLPANVLRTVCKELGIEVTGRREELTRKILASTDFEPYIGFVDRFCKICNVVTEHEIHYDNKWTPITFDCTICRIETVIPKEVVLPVQQDLIQSGNDETDVSVIWTLVGIGIAEFTAVFFGLSKTINLLVSILLSAFVSVATILGLVYSKQYWTLPLVRLLHYRARK